MLSFFPLDVLGEFWDLLESVSEEFLTYSSKYNVELKHLFCKTFQNLNFMFPYHFKKIIVRYIKIGYNIDVLRQTACLVVNPIKINNYAYLFDCTTVGRASD